MFLQRLSVIVTVSPRASEEFHAWFITVESIQASELAFHIHHSQSVFLAYTRPVEPDVPPLQLTALRLVCRAGRAACRRQIVEIEDLPCFDMLGYFLRLPTSAETMIVVLPPGLLLLKMGSWNCLVILMCCLTSRDCAGPNYLNGLSPFQAIRSVAESQWR